MSIATELMQPQPAASQTSSNAVSASSWVAPEAVVFLGVWLLLMVAGRQRLFQDPGTFWHTAVGQQMLASGQLVREDSFTFTFQGRPWIAHQWLGECLMALAFRTGGWDALLLGAATLLAGLFAWLTYRWRNSNASPVTITAVLIAVFVASAHHFHARPHIASIVLLPIAYSLLCDVEVGRARIRRLLWLLPLFLLWTNLHGGMLGGLATVALVVGGWIVAPLIHLPSPLQNWPQRLAALGVVLACAGTMFVNPFGVEMPRAWLTILRLSLPDVIQEHGRPDFARPEAWMVLALGVCYGTAVWRNRRWQVTSLVPMVWFLLACDRVRHAPLFAVLVAVAGAELCRRSAGTVAGQRSPTARITVLVATLLVVCCLSLQRAGISMPLLGSGWVQLNPSVWPVQLLDDLEQLPTQGKPNRLFNSLHFGGFLIFHTPKLKTFIDDRCELFADAFLRDYARAERETPAAVQLWQQEYGFGYALVQANTPLDRHLEQSRSWLLLRRTAAAVLYEHVQPPPRNLPVE